MVEYKRKDHGLIPSKPNNIFFFRCTRCKKIFDLRVEGRIYNRVKRLCDRCFYYRLEKRIKL